MQMLLFFIHAMPTTNYYNNVIYIFEIGNQSYLKVTFLFLDCFFFGN